MDNGLGNLSRSEFERNKFRNDPKHEIRLEIAEVSCDKKGSIRYQFLKNTKERKFSDFTTMGNGFMFVHSTPGDKEMNYLQQILHESGGTWYCFGNLLCQLGVQVALVGGKAGGFDRLEDYSAENGIYLFAEEFMAEEEMIPLPLNIFEANSRGARLLPFDEAQDIIRNSGIVGVPPLENRVEDYSFDNSRSKCRVVGCKKRNIKDKNEQLCDYHSRMLEYYDANNKMGWRIATDSDDDDNDVGDVEEKEDNNNAEMEDEVVNDEDEDDEDDKDAADNDNYKAEED